MPQKWSGSDSWTGWKLTPMHTTHRIFDSVSHWFTLVRMTCAGAVRYCISRPPVLVVRIASQQSRYGYVCVNQLVRALWYQSYHSRRAVYRGDKSAADLLAGRGTASTHHQLLISVYRFWDGVSWVTTLYVRAGNNLFESIQHSESNSIH